MDLSKMKAVALPPGRSPLIMVIVMVKVEAIV